MDFWKDGKQFDINILFVISSIDQSYYELLCNLLVIQMPILETLSRFLDAKTESSG